jgi:hypothetical protein
MKHWQVSLAIEVTAYMDALDNWDDQDVKDLACDAVMVETRSARVSLDLENVRAVDVVEVTE